MFSRVLNSGCIISKKKNTVGGRKAEKKNSWKKGRKFYKEGMQYKENLPNSYCDEKELTINVDKNKIMFKNLDAFIRNDKFYIKRKFIGSSLGYVFYFWLTFMFSGKAHTGIREFVKSGENLIFHTLKEEKSLEENITGLNCHERNLVPSRLFLSLTFCFLTYRDTYFPRLLTFFQKGKISLLFFSKRF